MIKRQAKLELKIQRFAVGRPLETNDRYHLTTLPRTKNRGNWHLLVKSAGGLKVSITRSFAAGIHGLSVASVGRCASARCKDGVQRTQKSMAKTLTQVQLKNRERI